MKKTNQILAFSIMITMCSFNSIAQSKIAHFDQTAYLKSLPSYPKFENELRRIVDELRPENDFKDLPMEEYQRKYDSARDAKTTEYFGKELKLINQLAKDSGVNYLWNTNQFGVVYPDKNLLTISKNEALPKIGHLNVTAYVETSPIYKTYQAQIKELNTDYLKHEKEIKEKSQKVTDQELYLELLTKYNAFREKVKEENRRLTNEFQQQVGDQINTLATENGYDYLLDSSSGYLIVVKGNEIKNAAESAADVKIAHAYWDPLFLKTPKLMKRLDGLRKEYDVTYKKVTSYEVGAILTQDFENAKQEIFNEVRATIYQIAANKGFDYVFILSEDFDITVVNGVDLTREIQHKLNN